MSNPNQGPRQHGRRPAEQPTRIARTGWRPRQRPPQSPPPGASPPYGAPPYGASPPYGAPQHRGRRYSAPSPPPGRPRYGAPPPYRAQPDDTPPYGAPQYGGPAAAYGAPAAGGGDGVVRRPGTVIAAAVIAFVYSGLIILLYLLALLMLTGRIDYATRHLGAALLASVYGYLLIRLAVGALFSWGGVRALRGRGRTLLVVSVVELVLALGGLAIRHTGTHRVREPYRWLRVRGRGAGHRLRGADPDLILLPSSTNFFRARRGTTNL